MAGFFRNCKGLIEDEGRPNPLVLGYCFLCTTSLENLKSPGKVSSFPPCLTAVTVE